MVEYIKREDALNAFPKLICTSDDRLALEFRKTFIKISALQSADVRENVRGEWIPINKYEFVCSACKSFWIERIFKRMHTYCPNCGAYMKGDCDV